MFYQAHGNDCLINDAILSVKIRFKYESSDVQLAKDEVLVLCTEGLVEAEIVTENGYSLSKLQKRLERPISSAAEFCSEVMKEYHEGCGEDQCEYDATLLCIRRVD